MAATADRRRVNGPLSGTHPPVFDHTVDDKFLQRPRRRRAPHELRKIYLRPGLTPSASGSAYLELEAPPSDPLKASHLGLPTLKLTCTVHGPRPLARSAAFSSNLVLSTHVKFAPFATRQRRGYIRDAVERDLGMHLETALRGMIIADRWPKSGVDVIITVLEGEEDTWWAADTASAASYDSRSDYPTEPSCSSLGLLTILSGCISVASAALVGAGLDCVDVAAGGVAALRRAPRINTDGTANDGADSEANEWEVLLDPCPSEHTDLVAACVVGYLKSRDEITEIWIKGALPADGVEQGKGNSPLERLIDGAAQAASMVQPLIIDSLKDVNVIK